MKNKIITQADKVKAKIINQAYKILSKVKIKENYREMSNQDVEILLASYAVEERLNNPKAEEIHNRLVRLTPTQMAAIRLIFFEGNTKSQTAIKMGISRTWLNQVLKTSYEVLKEPS